MAYEQITETVTNEPAQNSPQQANKAHVNQDGYVGDSADEKEGQSARECTGDTEFVSFW